MKNLKQTIRKKLTIYSKNNVSEASWGNWAGVLVKIN